MSVQTGEILAVATYDERGPVENLVTDAMPSIIRQLFEPGQKRNNSSVEKTGYGEKRFSPFQLGFISPVQVVPRKYSIYGISINCLYGQNDRVYGISTGLINHTKSRIFGISAGMINLSPRAVGLQAGLINITDDLTGMQVGLINIVRGRKRAPVIPAINVGF